MQFVCYRDKNRGNVDSATLPTRGGKRSSSNIRQENNHENFFTLPLPLSHAAKHRIPQDNNGLLRNMTPIQTRKELLNEKLIRIPNNMSTLPFTLPLQPQNKRRSNSKISDIHENSSTLSSRDINLDFSADTYKEHFKHQPIKETINGQTSKFKDHNNISITQQRIGMKSRITVDSSLNILTHSNYQDRVPLIMNGNGSPSTDSNDSSLPTNYRKLETSASVPHNLSEAANGVLTIPHSLSTASMPSVTGVHTLITTAANSSESMPNLVCTKPPKPTTLNVDSIPPLHRSPLLSSSLSESDITSEQSGWVSSHRSSIDTSSGQMSPTGIIS